MRENTVFFPSVVWVYDRIFFFFIKLSNSSNFNQADRLDGLYYIVMLEVDGHIRRSLLRKTLYLNKLLKDVCRMEIDETYGVLI